VSATHLSMILRTLLAISGLLFATNAAAWAENEHVRLGEVQNQHLRYPSPRQALRWRALTRMWKIVRDGDPALQKTLCAEFHTTYRGCIGLADLPMLAADHACSPGELAVAIRQTWPALVQVETAKADGKLRAVTAASGDPDTQRSQRLRIRRELDIDLQTADPGYLSRANGNRGHFAASRLIGENLRAHLQRTFAADHVTTTYSLYAMYHAAALRYAQGGSTTPARVRWALLNEAFALHYLQDSFSTGHIVGAPDDEARRFGTHDAYSSQGLEATTWSGVTYLAHGDAYLDDADEERAVEAMITSLDQLVDRFEQPGDGAGDPMLDPAVPVEMNLESCEQQKITAAFAPLARSASLQAVLERAPRPMADPPGAPAFWNEYGVFMPVFVGVFGDLSAYLGDLEPLTGNVTGRVVAGLGVGYASDGVLAEHTDGLFSIQALLSFGAFKRPERSTLGAGGSIRAPYAYFPFDFVIWAPLAAVGNRWGLERLRLATRADRTLFGAALPYWESGQTRLQIDFGREAMFLIHWTNEAGDPPTREIEGVDCGAGGTCVDRNASLELTRWDLTMPFVSLRTAHVYGNKFGNDFTVRLTGHVGHSVQPFLNGAVADEGHPGTYLGLGLSFQDCARIY
jgi:hypothetical protein